MATLRAIPLKNRRGGGKSSWPPRTKLEFVQPPGQNGYFPYPPRTQNSPDSFVQFYPPQRVFTDDFTSFLSIWPPSDSFFHPFYPHWTYFFTHFTTSDSLFWQFYPPQTFFRKCYHPRTPFLETPLGRKFEDFYPPGQKQGFSVPPSDRVIDPWPWDKKAISSPILFF